MSWILAFSHSRATECVPGSLARSKIIEPEINRTRTSYRVAKRLQAVVLNSESHSSGELAGILKAPRSKVSEWLARYEAYVGRFESPTSAARQLRGVLSTRVAVLSNQHHFALAGDGHNHHGRGHGEKRVAEPMAARADLYVVWFQREPTIVVNRPRTNFFYWRV